MACCLLLAHAHDAMAGGLFGNNRSVGGVSVDTEGIVSSPTVEDQQELAALRQNITLNVPAALEEFTPLRAVSLKHLEAMLAKSRAAGSDPPEEAEYLAGLLRIEYVFVYPEQNDVVIAGPAEGWKLDELGNVVGATTNRPVLQLDDLIVALRSGVVSRTEPITCSIDPTEQGLRQLQGVVARMRTIGNPEETMRRIEQALGPQTVSVTGVPAESHFARAMVAADFRMKRLAMNFEPAPVGGMPSFLHLMKASGRGMQNMMPRWWLAPKYDPLAKTADGLAWQLRGPGVQCLTEEDYVSAHGQKSRTGQANPVAAKWAATMTAQFSELADHDSAFGTLRNMIDLAVVGALIEKEGLLQRAQLQLPELMHQAAIVRYSVPRRTASKASFVKQGSNWVISASGGVQVLPWEVAERTETLESISAVKTQLATDASELWWE
jgi:hypothetical protein